MASARPVTVGSVPEGVTPEGNGANDALFATVNRKAPSESALAAGPNVHPETGAYLPAEYLLPSGAIRQDR